MPVKNRSAVTPQLVLGLFVILLGVLFTADNLGYLEVEQFFEWWPLLFIAFGLIKVTQSRGSGGRGLGVLFILLGAAILVDNLYWTRFNVWDLWPVVLVFAGGHLVWQTLRGSPPEIDEEGQFVRAAAVLGGVERTPTTQEFRGGELTAIMGGVSLDLRQASIFGEAEINTFALCGGIEIKVPENWTVVVQGFPLLGGFGDKTKVPEEVDQRLIVKGLALMGGVEITN